MNITTKEFTVKADQNGQRIDIVAAKIFDPKASRSHLQKYGTFTVKFGEKWATKSYKSKAQLDQFWRVSYEPPVDNFKHLNPWDTTLDIIAETDHWLVINKPIGVSVHPSASENSDHTVVNALLHHFGNKFSKRFEIKPPTTTNQAKHNTANQAAKDRPGIVHRIDKTTSGVLLIAKDDQTLRLLQKNWKNTQKHYVALVQGTPPNRGKIQGGIMRDPENRLRMKVSDHHKAREATTLFELLAEKDTPEFFRTDKPDGPKITPIKAELITGRTHQIRAHLSSIGFPIFGDQIYGGLEAERIFLHAHQLIFTDPQTNETITVTAPIPKNFGTPPRRSN